MSIRFVDRKLPVGVSEFELLLSDLKSEYADEIPTLDDDSLRFAISSNIMHLGPHDSHKSLDFFYKIIVAAAAKQIAHFVFQDVKNRQAQRQADEAAASAAKEVPSEPQE